tara:strand:+ start:7102 stop:7764 length:663 start_codon:yes stop_codon:yes gene_type:complete
VPANAARQNPEAAGDVLYFKGSLEPTNNLTERISNMTCKRSVLAFFCYFFAGVALASAPAMNAPLPTLAISERGELIADDEDFSFRPWSSEMHPGKVHVIQYIGAKMSDKDVFKPLTDAVESNFEPGSVQVTTVINLDAAMWGTTGMVMSELKKNKRKYPTAVMVVDEDGSGIDAWGLGKSGRGLLITTGDGIVKYFANEALNEEQLATTIELIRANIGD